jgi:hypothetical protein
MPFSRLNCGGKGQGKKIKKNSLNGSRSIKKRRDYGEKNRHQDYADKPDYGSKMVK